MLKVFIRASIDCSISIDPLTNIIKSACSAHISTWHHYIDKQYLFEYLNSFCSVSSKPNVTILDKHKDCLTVPCNVAVDQ